MRRRTIRWFLRQLYEARGLLAMARNLGPSARNVPYVKAELDRLRDQWTAFDRQALAAGLNPAALLGDEWVPEVVGEFRAEVFGAATAPYDSLGRLSRQPSPDNDDEAE